MDLPNRNKKILVTGGAGYIGSHACKSLAQAGYLPVVYDNLSKGHLSSVQWGPLEKGDMGDRERLESVFKTYRPDAVMHFAAFIEAGESVNDPGRYYENNTNGTLTLLRSMCTNDVKHIIFSSTAAVYGEPHEIPVPETHPQIPINPYGASKYMVERILTDFRTAYGLRYTALRYFNAAGADPEGDCGEDHTPETHLVPLVLQVALGDRSHITLNGDDYDTPDGSCIRDYVHVTDLVAAHILALEALLAGQVAPAYNLGNGCGFSVHEVIDAVRQVTNQKIPLKIGPRRPGDPAKLVADSSKAKRELGWTHEYAQLEHIIETAWQWAKKQKGKTEPT